MYNLYGVLVHAGYSSNSGHYYSYVRGPNGIWYLKDDSDVRVTIRGYRIMSLTHSPIGPASKPKNGSQPRTIHSLLHCCPRKLVS
jgi:hypothetical protein